MAEWETLHTTPHYLVIKLLRVWSLWLLQNQKRLCLIKCGIV